MDFAKIKHEQKKAIEERHRDRGAWFSHSHTYIECWYTLVSAYWRSARRLISTHRCIPAAVLIWMRPRRWTYLLANRESPTPRIIIKCHLHFSRSLCLEYSNRAALIRPMITTMLHIIQANIDYSQRHKHSVYIVRANRSLCWLMKKNAINYSIRRKNRSRRGQGNCIGW